MTNHSTLIWLIVLTPLIGMNGLVQADPPADGKALAVEVHLLAQREASAYTIRLEGSDRALTLRTEPVLKWSNPVVGTVFGEIFVWTDRGRPEVVVSSYKFYKPDPHRTNEFHSLATRKLSAERDGVVVWAPSRPGLDMTVIAGTAAPGDSAAVRLRQMRGAGAEFTGRDTNRGGRGPRNASADTAHLSLRESRGRPDRRSHVRLCGGYRSRGISAARSPPATDWCPRVAFRRGPHEQHHPTDQPPRPRGLDGTSTLHGASARPHGAVYDFPL